MKRQTILLDEKRWVFIEGIRSQLAEKTSRKVYQKDVIGLCIDTFSMLPKKRRVRMIVGQTGNLKVSTLV